MLLVTVPPEKFLLVLLSCRTPLHELSEVAPGGRSPRISGLLDVFTFAKIIEATLSASE
jgi:hypothetical protein